MARKASKVIKIYSVIEYDTQRKMQRIVAVAHTSLRNARECYNLKGKSLKGYSLALDTSPWVDSIPLVRASIIRGNWVPEPRYYSML